MSSSPATETIDYEALEPQTGAYFKATILDIKNGKVLANFENGWKREWIAAADVRPVPAPSDAVSPGTNPYSSGQDVEVLAQGAQDGPWGWWPAKIKSIKANVALVRFGGFAEDFDDIVDFGHIRPVNQNLPLDLRPIQRVELTLPELLKAPSAVSQIPSTFSTIKSNTGVICIAYDEVQHKIVVVGTATSLAKARLLVDLHVQHMTELQVMQNKTEQYRAQLAQARDKVRHVEEFTISTSAIGLAIGTKGARFKCVQSMPGILSVSIDAQTGQIRIVAENAEAAHAARQELEFTEMTLDIAPDSVPWLVGKNGRVIQHIETSSKAIRIQVVDNKAIRIFGTRESVANAKMLIESHLAYRSQFEKCESEQRQITQQLQEMQIETGTRPLAAKDKQPQPAASKPDHKAASQQENSSQAVNSSDGKDVRKPKNRRGKNRESKAAPGEQSPSRQSQEGQSQRRKQYSKKESATPAPATAT